MRINQIEHFVTTDFGWMHETPDWRLLSTELSKEVRIQENSQAQSVPVDSWSCGICATHPNHFIYKGDAEEHLRGYAVFFAHLVPESISVRYRVHGSNTVMDTNLNYFPGDCRRVREAVMVSQAADGSFEIV